MNLFWAALFLLLPVAGQYYVSVRVWQLLPAIPLLRTSVVVLMALSFIGFFVGKFIANILMTKFNENKVLIVYSILGVLALLYVINVHNMSAVWAAIFTSALFGPCWATIYARTLDTIEDKRHTETGGAVIVMSIIGGAVIPVIQGFVSDHTGSMQTAFVVSLLCFVAVLVYFISARRWELQK